MRQIDSKGASLESLRQALGEALSGQIKRKGDKQDFAREAGIHRDTLRRMLSGQNVSTEVLFRVLRTLERYDLIDALITPPAPTPLELLNRAKPARPKHKPDLPEDLKNALKTGQKGKPHA